MFDAEGFGRHLKLFVRGASHAPSLTFTLENFPRGFAVDRQALAAFMERRAPGRDKYSTQRRESDAIEFVSGLARDVTTGAAICGRIANQDARPNDYGSERTAPRPGHADFGQWVEMGRIPTGGGKNSGRMTAALCAAGGLCKQWLERRGMGIAAQMQMVGGESDEGKMLAAIEQARCEGDSIGGCVHCEITCPPVGLGGALFDGLESAFSAALFAIPGVKAVLFGSGGTVPFRRGSAFNDAFCVMDGEVGTKTNRHGGLLGGRTSGMPICFDVLFKPTPTIYQAQETVDLATLTPGTLAMKGRHDPCIVRRAVPVVEAMAAYVLADAILADEAARPRICLTLTGKTLNEDVAQYSAQRYFTDMVEVRADLLNASERTKVAQFPKMLEASGHTHRKIPVLLTFRRACDGGAFEGNESVRVSFFRKALTSGAFAYVDFEDDFRVSALEDLARKVGTRIVRSLHVFDGPVRNLAARCRALVGATDEIAKVAFMPQSLNDVARLFRADIADMDVPHVVCAMGPMGLASRVLAGRTHSLWTYASVGGLGAIGHITPYEMVRTYRCRSVSRDAALYGVTGWPLTVTRSPEINNAAWGDADEDRVMVPFPAETAAKAVAFFKAMGMRGMAVTIPHKQTIMPLLDRVDAAARKVGAVNTVVNVSGALVGYNTDVEGFSTAIRAFVGRDCFKGLRVAVLGAGGASKAVVYALRRLKATVRVFHRTTPPQGYDVIVNATPVDPILDYIFTGKEKVYDLVYVPAVTPLMARAQAAGCKTENGFTMLVAQAAAQRRLWI